MLNMQTAPQIVRFNFFGGTIKPSRFGRSYWFWNHLWGSIGSTVDRFPKKLLASPRKAIKLAKEAAAGEVRQDSPNDRGNPEVYSKDEVNCHEG